MGQKSSSLGNQNFLPSSLFSLQQGASRGEDKAKDTKAQDKAQWFQLFADLDPLANPDTVGKTGGWEGGC